MTEFKVLRRDIDVLCNKLDETGNKKENMNNYKNEQYQKQHNHNNNTVFSNTTENNCLFK